MATAILTHDQVSERLRYDPDTGVLYWRKNSKRAGTRHRLGYRNVFIKGRSYAEHRVAWLLMTGSWPAADIDHINRIRNDNRFCNLRVLTRAENCQNQPIRRNNRSGVTGVHFHKAAAKWVAVISIDGSLKHLGVFDTVAAAAQARRSAEEQHYAFRPL